MPRSCRSFTVRAGAFIAAALATAAVMPHAAQAQPAAFRNPQFVANVLSVKALHETHSNWMGSDEVYALIYDFQAVTSRRTATFGDVDAGETRNFAPEDSCASPLPRCERGATSIGFGIALYEQDQPPFQFCHGAVDSSPPPTPEQYETTFDAIDDSCDDDLIGRAKVKLSQADLLAALPTVGAYFDKTVAATGGDGRYEVTYRITRRPNAINIPPVGPAVELVPISLQAMARSVGTTKIVALAWSGATTATVDIYRGGAVLTTTANDGSHFDSVLAGTYKYRLCNAGSTTFCSAEVEVVVT